MGDVDPACASSDAMEASIKAKFEREMHRMENCIEEVASSLVLENANETLDMDDADRQVAVVRSAFKQYKETLALQMRHQPLGRREWLQMFESYMTFACAEEGLGFIQFSLL